MYTYISHMLNTSRNFMCDMTHSYVWYSFIYETPLVPSPVRAVSVYIYIFKQIYRRYCSCGIYTYIYTYGSSYIYIHKRVVYIYIRLCLYIYIPAYLYSTGPIHVARSIRTWSCASLYIYIHKYIHKQVVYFVYVRLCLYMYKYIHK